MVKCRAVNENDFVKTADFLSSEPLPGNRDNWMGHFEHWWVQNPVFNDNCVRGWVLETENKEIVGFLGNIPQLFKLGENDVSANISTSWCVKEEYRRHSLKLFDSFLSQQKTPLCIATGAGKQLHAIHFRWGYKHIPLGSFNHVLYWILNPNNCLKYALMSKGYSNLASNLAGWLGFLPLEVMNRVRGNWGLLSKADLQVEEVTECGAGFDLLWERISRQYFTISVRTADVINWHYNLPENGDKKYHVLACFENDSISGYAVYRVIENPIFHLKQLRIVDFVVEYQKEDVVLALLNSVLEAGRKEKAAFAGITGGVEWICETLRTTRPFIVKNNHVAYFYIARDPAIATRLDDPDAWFATEYDGDSSLF